MNDLMKQFHLDDEGLKAFYRPISPDWLNRVDEAMKVLHEGFQVEDQEGYPALIRRLRGWTWSHQVPKDHDDYVSMKHIAEIAHRIRSKAKVFITVGIGGSDLGSRTLHDLLSHPYHNQLVATDKMTGIPEIYFTGDTFDPIRLRALLEVLQKRELLHDTYINIVSKSGTTAETALAGMILAEAMGEDWMSRTVATTGLNEKSMLYNMQEAGKYKFMDMLPVPDGVGGRFSYASPVGLLLLAVTAQEDPEANLNQAMDGFRQAHEAFLNTPPEKNLAFQLAKYLYVAKEFAGKTSLVFYPYFDNAKLGDWFVQLYEESLQERCSGLNILATTGPTGNHSLLNGIVNGARDKITLFLTPEDFGDSMMISQNAPLKGSLEIFKGLSMQQAQVASMKGTIQDFQSRHIPTTLLTFPKRDTASVFALMRLLMDMVAVKGRLRSLHIDPITGKRKIENEETYTQSGVEGYKERMRENI